MKDGEKAALDFMHAMREQFGSFEYQVITAGVTLKSKNYRETTAKTEVRPSLRSALGNRGK